MRLWEGGTTLQQLPVLRAHQRPVYVLGGEISGHRQGGGGGSKVGGTKGRAAVVGGQEKATASRGLKQKDDNDRVDSIQDGGRGGACRGSSRVRARGGGPADPRVIQGLGALQRWIAP